MELTSFVRDNLLSFATIMQITPTRRPLYAHVVYDSGSGLVIMTIGIYDIEHRTFEMQTRSPEPTVSDDYCSYVGSEPIPVNDPEEFHIHVKNAKKGFRAVLKKARGMEGKFVEFNWHSNNTEVLESFRSNGVFDVYPWCGSKDLDMLIGRADLREAIELDIYSTKKLNGSDLDRS